MSPFLPAGTPYAFLIRDNNPIDTRSMNIDPCRGGYFLDLAILSLGDAVLRFENSALGPGWLLFQNPKAILETNDVGEVLSVVAAAEGHAKAGSFAVGFLTYESAPGLNPKVETQTSQKGPLCWFAIYDSSPTHWRELKPYSQVEVGLVSQDFDESTYERAFYEVKRELAVGSTYQVNLTFRQHRQLVGAAHELFAAKCGVNPPPYAAFIHGGSWQVASFSPELFFERSDRQVTMKPMKGTASMPKERRDAEDVARTLVNDPKTVAENLMIVDMVRNDLGQVADVGSVKTLDLLKVERHGAILQVTSCVTADVGCTTMDLLSKTFPAASVTGAPKISTCDFIATLEKSPRGVYCGAIGMIGPQDQARFSVGIRTATIRGDEVEYGIGSGIVWDSTASSEFRECLLKANVIETSGQKWELIEAIHLNALADPSLLALHVERLSQSASEFGVRFDEAALRNRLSEIKPRGNKIRVTLGCDGEIGIATGESFFGSLKAVTASIALSPVFSGDPNLRHKTTSRGVYDQHLEMAPMEAHDVLLFNELGQVTEFCQGNVIVNLNGKLITPAPECGCLPGIGVHQLVHKGEVSYGAVSLDKALKADKIYFVNAVVGMLPVEILIPATLREPIVLH